MEYQVITVLVFSLKNIKKLISKIAFLEKSRAGPLIILSCACKQQPANN
jgi:hypothetical protein